VLESLETVDDVEAGVGSSPYMRGNDPQRGNRCVCRRHEHSDDLTVVGHLDGLARLDLTQHVAAIGSERIRRP